jgi:hypothetical protein
MIGQTNSPALVGSEAWGVGANAAQESTSPGRIENAADGASKMMERAPPANPPAPKAARSAATRTLEAYIERRKRLADRIRAEHPSYTEAEVEERMEQFGAYAHPVAIG